MWLLIKYEHKVAVLVKQNVMKVLVCRDPVNYTIDLSNI